MPLLRKGGGVAGVSHLNSVFSNMDEIFFYLNDNVTILKCFLHSVYVKGEQTKKCGRQKL